MKEKSDTLRIAIWVDDVAHIELFVQAIQTLIMSPPHERTTVVAASGNQMVHVHGPEGEIPYVAPDELAEIGMEVLLIVGVVQHQRLEHGVRAHLKALGLSEDTFVFDYMVCIPGFSWDKYQKLRHSQLSIVSMNCFGGLLMHQLGMPFLTPTVNLYFLEDEYLCMLKDLRSYLSAFNRLSLETTAYNDAEQFEYPVFRLKDVHIFMNHNPLNQKIGDKYADEVKWYERLQRINWYNLFVTMYTERPEIAREFDKLPFAKKACFVPFSSDLDSAWQIDVTAATGKKIGLWDAVNRFGFGDPWFYDPFDMLLYGKKTSLLKTGDAN